MLKMIKYEMLILLKEDFNDSELKSWAFNYAKTLQQLSPSTIFFFSIFPSLFRLSDTVHQLVEQHHRRSATQRQNFTKSVLFVQIPISI